MATTFRKLAGAWLLLLFAASAVAEMPSDAQIRAILRDRVEVAGRGVGIVVGIVDRSGRRVIPYGTTDLDGGRAVDGDTLFEIGSITKVFTGLLLADMVKRGEVSLDDPVSKYLPAGVRAPRVGGSEVTLLQLATHTSGLPTTPPNLPLNDWSNLYAGYSIPLLYEFLATYEPPAVARQENPYSNLGYGLLGHVLALRANTDYEVLLRTRILEPLALDSTGIELNEAQRSRLSPGHNSGLYAVPRVDVGSLSAAGALRSSMKDMLTFTEASLGLKLSPLHEAMQFAMAPKDAAGLEALAWRVRSNGDVVTHIGLTGGFTSFIAMDLRAGKAVIVLANSTNPVMDIGEHIFYGNKPLAVPAPSGHDREVKLADVKAFDAYVGTYEFTPAFSIVVTREGDRFFSQATGKRKLELFAKSDSEFFLKVVEARLSFVRNDAGVVAHLLLHQNGQETRGRKLP